MPRVNIKDLGIGTGTLSCKEPKGAAFIEPTEEDYRVECNLPDGRVITILIPREPVYNCLHGETYGLNLVYDGHNT